MTQRVGIGMTPLEYTASGWPAVGGDVLETLAGDPQKGKFGKAMQHYSDPDQGKCVVNHFVSTTVSKRSTSQGGMHSASCAV